jgi:RND family efflux transporter MFP subunit
VADKTVEPGNMAAPGTALMRIEDTRGFRLDVRVDESRVGAIVSGAIVPVSVDAGPGGATTTLQGRVAEIGRAVDADARAFLVKITLPDAPGLRSGTFGRASFNAQTRRVLTVPDGALVRRGQVTSVLVVEKGIARLRLVNVSGVEVLAGLSEGDVVIVAAPPAVTDGRRVSEGGR